MAVSLANGDGKDFSFMFRGSSCQGDFFGGVELHNLDHNFLVNISVNNVVVELLQ